MMICMIDIDEFSVCLCFHFIYTDYKFTVDCAGALCQALGPSTSLETVMIWKDRIDDFTANEVIRLLSVIPTLRTINLGQNMLTVDGKKYIEERVKCNFPGLEVRMF